MAVHAGRAVFEQGIDDPRGNAQRGVLVYVYLRGTNTPATLYTDRTKAETISNPITTNGLGNVAIFADPGEYDAMVNGATLRFTVLPDWEDVGTPIASGTYLGPAAPVVGAADSTVLGALRVTGDVEDRLRLRPDGLDLGTPGNLSSRQRLYATGAGLELDNSLTLRKEVTGGTAAPEIILRSKASDGSFPFWLSGAIDVANTIKGRDLVIAAKGDYPAAGNVWDFVMCPHNGSGPPGLAVGGWPPDAAAMAHFQINALDLTKVTMRVGFVASQTGDLLRVGGPSADTFVVRADTGVRVKSASAEAFSVRTIGNSINFLVDATGAGKVLSPALLFGIGNAFAAGGTPANNLDISVTTGNTASIRARSAIGSDFQAFVPADLTTGTKVGTTLATPLHIQTNNTTRMSFGSAGEIGFFGAAAVAKPTGVAVTAAAIHAALVTLGLIAA